MQKLWEKWYSKRNLISRNKSPMGNLFVQGDEPNRLPTGELLQAKNHKVSLEGADDLYACVFFNVGSQRMKLQLERLIATAE